MDLILQAQPADKLGGSFIPVVPLGMMVYVHWCVFRKYISLIVLMMVGW
jgi:hypothetical protein